MAQGVRESSCGGWCSVMLPVSVTEDTPILPANRQVRASRGPAEHGLDCACQRCAGFAPGNAVAVVHGARSSLRLAPRAAELAEELAAIVPASSPSDEPTVRLLALVLARVEFANEYLAEHGLLDADGVPRPVLKMLSTWENTCARLLDRLGCTPTSRGALGLDLVRAQESAVVALQRQARARDNGGTA